MKASTVLKFGSLVALAVATSLLTSSILAGSGRYKHRRVLASQAAAGPQQPAVMGDTKQSVPPGQPVQAAALPLGHVRRPADALFHFEHCNVTPGPGRITIDARASIMDSRPVRTPYVWSVVVKDETGNNIVLNHRYDQQVFEVPAGETHRPTFKDTLPLQPGDYFVELRLNAVAPQIPPTVPSQSQSGVLISGGGFITVPGS